MKYFEGNNLNVISIMITKSNRCLTLKKLEIKYKDHTLLSPTCQHNDQHVHTHLGMSRHLSNVVSVSLFAAIFVVDDLVIKTRTGDMKINRGRGAWFFPE